MIRRWLINGILLGILILLIALIRAELERARFIPVLTDLNPAAVYRVEILRPGEPNLNLIQTALGWHLETPFQTDADNARVSRLLGVLESPVERSLPAQSVDLRELGLSPPRLRLRVDGRELQFGLTDPIGQARYVALDGVVHLIPDHFYHLLIAPPIDYVSPKLIPLGFAPIFGRLGEIPLAAETLNTLLTLHAERVEVMAEAPAGTPLRLKSDGHAILDFLVSADRRRWARLDQRLLYVLAEPIELILDSNATDPFPELNEWPENKEPAPQVQTSETASPTAPPTVRLNPDAEGVMREQSMPLLGEPDKPVPDGLGQDPFAPEPAFEIPDVSIP